MAMTLDIKSIAIFLPFVSACLLGINYTMNGRIYLSVSMPTWICVFSLTSLVVAVVLHFLSPLKINFAPVFLWPTSIYTVISLIAGIGTWLLMIIVVQNISASYAAIGEVSYPFFTVLFTYFIFQAKEIDVSTAIGGMLIMIGSFIVITDKIKIGG